MGYLLGLIGNPAKHSLSPWMQEQFLNDVKVNGIYRAYEIGERDFSDFIYALKKMEIDGFNITIPYKQKIMEYVDEIHESARKIGAINTVVNRAGKWIGYNTDGIGFVRALQHEYPNFFHEIENKQVLIIGAGGAARGIFYALNQKGLKRIDIANRTISKAEVLKEIKENSVETNVLTLESATYQIDQYDLIVQTTNVGMAPNEGMSPVHLKKLKDNSIVSDIVYKPFETEILRQSKELGARVLHGHGMLLFQGVESFKLWTGKQINPTNVLDELEKKLTKKGD